ncbi:MAG: PIN domain-containing protein [Candidatus Aegiribacteria sp.]|nr:PIN domain-containing protein [Candidatus Aegiribacteria sp.]MBD3295241.1 PIN domain-containing protein [Candidatus Fermentibacteria bacterium]
MHLVDTSGWIEYFFDEPNADRFAEAIEDTENLIVSVVNQYEVFKKVLLATDEAKGLRAVAQMKQGQVIPLTEEITLLAAKMSIEHKLPMADSMIYATGLHMHATVWTQDDDFRDLPGVEYVEKS